MQGSEANVLGGRGHRQRNVSEVWGPGHSSGLALIASPLPASVFLILQMEAATVPRQEACESP